MGCLSSVIHPGAIYEPSCIDKLTDAQLDEFREAFNMFDKDGSGIISADEIREVLCFGGANSLSAEAVDAIIKQVDENGDGEI